MSSITSTCEKPMYGEDVQHETEEADEGNEETCETARRRKRRRNRHKKGTKKYFQHDF